MFTIDSCTEVNVRVCVLVPVLVLALALVAGTRNAQAPPSAAVVAMAAIVMRCFMRLLRTRW